MIVRSLAPAPLPTGRAYRPNQVIAPSCVHECGVVRRHACGDIRSQLERRHRALGDEHRCQGEDDETHTNASGTRGHPADDESGLPLAVLYSQFAVGLTCSLVGSGLQPAAPAGLKARGYDQSSANAD
jgi:hypothetical protein